MGSSPISRVAVLKSQRPLNFAAPRAPAGGAAFWRPAPQAPQRPCQPWMIRRAAQHSKKQKTRCRVCHSHCRAARRGTARRPGMLCARRLGEARGDRAERRISAAPRVDSDQRGCRALSSPRPTMLPDPARTSESFRILCQPERALPARLAGRWPASWPSGSGRGAGPGRERIIAMVNTYETVASDDMNTMSFTTLLSAQNRRR